MSRLPHQPGERIDRTSPVTFSFDGKSVSGFAGDTIASALYASGQQIFSRSFKYHRPRGELCFCGNCANSLMTVDGRTGVRACAEPITAGMDVIHQNAWPSLNFDVMSATNRMSKLLPPGFYYKTFIRPRRLWPTYEKVLRSAAGLGKLPEHQDERTWRTEYRRRHCDVLVVGGGIAGLSAALAAAEHGADVVLCDDDAELGGRLLAEGGRERAEALAQACRDAGVELLSAAPALGYFDGLVPVWQGSTLHQVRAARIVVATGTIEQPLVFGDNDLPGVMLSSAAQRAARVFALKPGERAVVAATSDAGLDAALTLHDAGVDLAAVADLRPEQTAKAAELIGRGVDVRNGQTIVGALGRRGVQGAVLSAVDAQGVARGAGSQVECDLVLVNGPAAPATSLLLQSGARARYDEATGRFAAGELPADVFVAGSVAGHQDAGAAACSGTLAGLSAAQASAAEIAGAQAALDEQPEQAPVATPPAVASQRSRKAKAFVDLDEDVTASDIAHAADEGYESIELSKRYTTATMGPSQGRFSQLAAIRALGHATGQQLDDIGVTTARPPWVTVPLGALAGRPFEAAKRSPIAMDGANVRWAGDWRRAYDYGDPEGEALAVQNAAGLIDVSTLGKLLVRGPDAGELLDRLYPNRMSTVPQGRIRYGVMVSDAGRITDDGTVCRLADDTFYVTTTSSGAAAVESQMTWWQTAWELDATITDLTQGMAAMNLAGPQARQILTSLTKEDCSNEALAYLDAREMQIAGIDCLVLRIGFVGEVGYEVHCAAAHGQAVWDAITAAGADLGLRHFGLEPQRLLRLQKMHILVGQDTDSETTPYGADLGWAVKLDKSQEFIGKWALAEQSQQTPQTLLVGFTCPGGELPTEGAVVLADGEVAGQVTSARRSPKLGKTIGLATVPPRLAHDDARFWISDDGAQIAAVVTTTPFYDPDGEVLRS